MTVYSATIPANTHATVTKAPRTTLPAAVTTASGTTGIPPTVGQRWPAGIPTATNR